MSSSLLYGHALEKVEVIGKGNSHIAENGQEIHLIGFHNSLIAHSC